MKVIIYWTATVIFVVAFFVSAYLWPTENALRGILGVPGAILFVLGLSVRMVRDHRRMVSELADRGPEQKWVPRPMGEVFFGGLAWLVLIATTNVRRGRLLLTYDVARRWRSRGGE